MENRTILSPPDIELDRSKVFRRLSVEERSEDGEKLASYILISREIARPKIYLAFSYVTADGDEDDAVRIDGVSFAGSFVREKLKEAGRVYPYVVTCGWELEEWSHGIEDMVESYWADFLKEEYLRAAFQHLRMYLKTTRAEEKLAHLSPGSLAAWPIREQRPLFRLLGDVKAAVGVELTESCLMIPAKSVSGILFPTETKYENCMHCPRPICPNRRAPFQGAVT